MFPGGRRLLRLGLGAAARQFQRSGASRRPGAAAEIGHAGIYLGRGWMIHSSSQGVSLAPLTGTYATRFAWGRRPLAEAGLSS